MNKTINKIHDPKYLFSHKYFGSDDLDTVFVEIRPSHVILRKSNKEYEMHPKNFIQLTKKINRYKEIQSQYKKKQTIIALNPNNNLVKKLFDEVINTHNTLRFNGSSSFKINNQTFDLFWRDTFDPNTMEFSDQIKTILFSEKLKEQDIISLLIKHNAISRKLIEYQDQRLLSHIYAYRYYL